MPKPNCSDAVHVVLVRAFAADAAGNQGKLLLIGSLPPQPVPR